VSLEDTETSTLSPLYMKKKKKKKKQKTKNKNKNLGHNIFFQKGNGSSVAYK
jgi:hypothetical protein